MSQRPRLRGSLQPPGDKSIAHRAALLASLARGTSEIIHFAPGEDCRRTLELLRAIGVPIESEGDRVLVSGRGHFGFRLPGGPLDAGNSGSTIRMACGLLAPQSFDSCLTGDESLRRRPMRRVIEPLERMGASIEAAEGGRAPLLVRGGRNLRGVDHEIPVPSAQIKTALLLAGLLAEGETRVREPLRSRDHTELALGQFAVSLALDNGWIGVRGGSPLQAARLRLPGDISSAAFFIAGATVLPGSELLVREVGLNPTRTGLLEVLRSMGAKLTVEEETFWGGEKVGSVRVRSSELFGVTVPEEVVPRLIDEVPVLGVAAAFARGETVIRGARELRLKESDRIRSLWIGLSALGAEVEELPDGLVIRGGRPLRATRLESFGDHRLAMAWAVAALAVGGPCPIEGADSVAISYPGFWRELERLTS